MQRMPNDKCVKCFWCMSVFPIGLFYFRIMLKVESWHSFYGNVRIIIGSYTIF